MSRGEESELRGRETDVARTNWNELNECDSNEMKHSDECFTSLHPTGLFGLRLRFATT